MYEDFEPDYRNIVKAARNIEVERIPLYEHGICGRVMEDVLGKKFCHLCWGDAGDAEEYFRNYCNFFYKMGFDVPIFEAGIAPIMPGSGALGGHKEGVIKDRADFEKYPWDEIPEIYFKTYSNQFDGLAKALPKGGKALGGPGYGIFECVQDIVGYMNLCYISADDPDLYHDLFFKVGETNFKIWSEFLRRWGDSFCVCRFGDDLGFKSTTLIAADDIRKLIIPQYKRIIDLVHSYGKPFLLHSCGCIFDVMDDLIETAGIDAKHSNEDQIARFPVWVQKYGDRIGNFGGVDTDAVCRLSRPELKEYILDLLPQCIGHGGYAFSTGNSIPDYCPTENYCNMVEIFREFRKA